MTRLVPVGNQLLSSFFIGHGVWRLFVCSSSRCLFFPVPVHPETGGFSLRVRIPNFPVDGFPLQLVTSPQVVPGVIVLPSAVLLSLGLPWPLLAPSGPGAMRSTAELLVLVDFSTSLDKL